MTGLATDPDADTDQADETETPAPVVRRPRRAPREPRVWPLRIAMALVPGTLCWALHVDLGFGGNNIDPYIYVGTVTRFGDFLARWPATYYPYRFGYIFPEWLSEKAFGGTAGYLLVRFALMGVIAATLARSARGRRDWAIGLSAAAIFTISPVMLRAVFTTYSESFAALFLVLAIAVLAPVRSERGIGLPRALGGGALLALSWNAHAPTLPLCLVATGAVVLDSLIEHRGKAFVRHVGAGVAVLVGMGVVVGAATLVYGLGYDRWNILKPLVDQASKPTDDVFLEHTATWFTWRHYLLAIPAALALGVVAWRTSTDDRERRGLRRLVVAVAAMTAVYAVFQWGRDDPLLSIYYYSSFIITAAWYLLARSVVSIASVDRPRRWVAAPIAAGLVLGSVWLGAHWKPAYAVVAVLFLAALAIGALAVWRPPVALAGAAVLLVSAGFVSTSSPHDFPGSSPGFKIDPYYDGAIFAPSEDGLDIYRLARDYAAFVPTAPEHDGRLRVWFRPTGTTEPVNQVQATLVHGFSALQPFPNGGLPELTPFELTRLDEERPRFLVLIDGDPAFVDLGVAALRNAGEPYRVRKRRTFTEGPYSVDVAVMERTDGQWIGVP